MKKIILVSFLFVFLLFPSIALAQPSQEEVLEGRVLASLKEDIITQAGKQYLYQKLKVVIAKGSLSGKEVIIEVGNIPLVSQPKYRPGDEVLINYSHDFEGNEVFYITDFIRRKPLVWLFLLFIIPPTFYLSHGFNKKTTVAILGTLAALGLTGILAKVFVETAKITGYASEEAGFLQVARPGVVNIRGLVLAGIIIGALGVLDDITVSQAAIVQQLKETGSKIPPKELFSRAMSVGQDHIASMINTLVLVYTGAALPLLLLFIDNPHPLSEIINYEIIAEEIIRTLVGSIGLITAVPITTFLASSLSLKK